MSTADLAERPATRAAANPYLRGNFAPVEVETTAFDLEVEGEIPEALEGRLVRIGPNPAGPVDPANYHWFTGSGMVHGLRLRGGRAEWYRNRYVVGEGVARATGRANIPGPVHGFGDNANTNVLELGGRTHALVEAGALPVELSYELESVRRSDLDGTLTSAFSAHPKPDPATGEQHVMAYMPTVQSLRYLVVGVDGRARTVADIPAPHGPMVHDIAITQRFAIVLDLPVVLNFDALATGLPYAWDHARTPRVGLLPRTGELEALRWFEAPDGYVFHVMNAYEDEAGRVVVDVVKHPRMFDLDRRGPNEGEPVLVRWTLDLKTGRLEEAMLFDRGCEFPRLNDAFAARPYRYGYTAAAGEGLRFGPAYKHDLETLRTETHDYGPGRQTLEPVFVAREGAAAEDDGYILSYVYDAGRGTSDVVILDAQRFAEAPLATVRLPVRVPFGFHGNWLADRAPA